LLVLPGREEDELARPGRVLHRLRAQISLFPAGSVAVALEERRGFGLRRRLHLDIGHHIKRRWTLSEHFEGRQEKQRGALADNRHGLLLRSAAAGAYRTTPERREYVTNSETRSRGTDGQPQEIPRVHR